jgi:murein DD-endopeptidase MepM/ murein hydrolase activator NlpD
MYHTILIMPSIPGKRTLKCILPVRAWALLCVLMSMLCALSALGIWGLHHYEEVNDRCLWLASQNRAVTELLDSQLKRERSILREFNQLREQAAFVRGFLGLQSQGADGRLGQGGAEVGPERLRPGIEGSRGSAADRPSPTPLLPEQIVLLGRDMAQVVRTLESRQEEMERTPSISPVDPRCSWLSSPFGIRISPFTGKEQFHVGLDIAASRGTPIVATAKGTVIQSDTLGPLGLTVKIQHGHGLVTEYGHLLRSKVKPGQQVKRGEVIGYMGDSGRSTGYHLHYGIRKNGEHVDPRPHMMDWEKTALFTADADSQTPWLKSKR